MAEKKQDQEAEEQGVRGVDWGQRRKELRNAIDNVMRDAGDKDLTPKDRRQVNQHLFAASAHHKEAFFSGDVPEEKREENVQSAFEYLGKAKEILGKSPDKPRKAPRLQLYPDISQAETQYNWHPRTLRGI